MQVLFQEPILVICQSLPVVSKWIFESLDLDHKARRPDRDCPSIEPDNDARNSHRQSSTETLQSYQGMTSVCTTSNISMGFKECCLLISHHLACHSAGIRTIWKTR